MKLLFDYLIPAILGSGSYAFLVSMGHGFGIV